MKILACERTHSLETALAFVRCGHEFFEPKETIPDVHEFGRAELIQTIKDLKPDVLLVGLKFVIDQEIIDLGIKLVATRTTGTDHITGKVEIIKLVGEELTEVVAVPELICWAMLELVRKRDGRELKGKTLGIIGFGRIGTILDKYAQALEMKVRWTDSFSVPDTEIFQEDLVDVLYHSDIVSLNISSTEE